MIKLTYKRGFDKTNSFFGRLKKKIQLKSIEKWGEKGVAALSKATPVDTGTTSKSWSYSVIRKKDFVEIRWSNSNVNNGVNIALIIQYGHAARNGVYIEGRDYINPALKEIFDEIEKSAWKEVSSA